MYVDVCMERPSLTDRCHVSSSATTLWLNKQPARYGYITERPIVDIRYNTLPVDYHIIMTMCIV